MIYLKINFLFFIIKLLTYFKMYKLFLEKILLFRQTHHKKIDEILKSEIYLFLISHKYILKSWNVYSLIFIKESYYEIN